ncbi:MAG: hypothetical protein JXB05_23580 [Myxococcaceae bacterium]|nr:hypothetical protein [Myxococcaceae bacterium]
MDAGADCTDAGLQPGLAPCTGLQALPEDDCAAGLCLRHEYTLSGPYEFHGLWGSSPDDVFLAARALPQAQVPAQVVRFSEGRFTSAAVLLPDFQPFRLQGSDAENVWAINEAPTAGPCWLSDKSRAIPVFYCPSPVFHFNGKSWAPVPSATQAPTPIQPPALHVGADATWVASSDQGLLRWTGSMWLREPSTLAGSDSLHALWGDTSGPRTRSSRGASAPLVAIAGPTEEHLYAATSSEVLRWAPGEGWQSEFTAPELDGQAPSVQDLWVSADGHDVWVTLKTSYVLRKHHGAWSVLQLSVPSGFEALQVYGFDTPGGDLWITGTHSHGDLFFGTIAYHYERQEQ